MTGPLLIVGHPTEDGRIYTLFADKTNTGEAEYQLLDEICAKLAQTMGPGHSRKQSKQCVASLGCQVYQGHFPIRFTAYSLDEMTYVAGKGLTCSREQESAKLHSPKDLGEKGKASIGYISKAVDFANSIFDLVSNVDG